MPILFAVHTATASVNVWFSELAQKIEVEVEYEDGFMDTPFRVGPDEFEYDAPHRLTDEIRNVVKTVYNKALPHNPKF